MTPDPQPCEYVGCSRFEPDEMVARETYTETGSLHWYCGDHDPLEDDEVADLWQEADA